MEENSNAVFYGKDLATRFPEEFRDAVRNRLLRRIPTEPHFGTYDLGLSRPLLVVEGESGLEAIDDENPEADPIPLTSQDLERYAVNLKVFAENVQRENQLTGKPESLGDRLFFIGEAECEGTVVAYVLALLNGSPIVQSNLCRLRNYLPTRYGRICVICPSRLPDMAERRQFESQHIEVASLRADQPFMLPKFGRTGLDLEFKYIPESRLVIIKGISHRLSDRQNVVICVLNDARMKGNPDVPWEIVKKQLIAHGFSPDRMADIFKKSPLLYLIKHSGRGLYRLNV